MTFDDYVNEVSPIVHKIICECITMSAEAYQEYKIWIKRYLYESDFFVKKLFDDVFELIEKYRIDFKEK